MKARLVVIGGGGHAKVVIDAARCAGAWEVVAVLDDNAARHGTELLGIPVRGAATPSQVVAVEATHAVVAIGDNRARSSLVGRLQRCVSWATIVHPRATIAASATIGEGSVIMAGAVIQPDVHVGRHAILNTGCSLDHDDILGDFGQVSPGAHLAGNVRVGEGAFIGTGAAVIPGTVIGTWATVAAGACVVHDVPDRATVMGVPARLARAAGETR